MHQCRRPNRLSETGRGFTLTEILLVVAIIAMVGGLGSGYCVGTYKKLLVEKAARQFLLMARYARIMAIEQQRPYELMIDPNNQGFLLATAEADPETGESQKTVVRDFFCKPVRFEGEVKFEDVQMALYCRRLVGGCGRRSRRSFFCPTARPNRRSSRSATARATTRSRWLPRRARRVSTRAK